jgi:hypothetical protein
MMRAALAEAVAGITGDTSETFIEELIRSYDGSIDAYLRALNCRHFEEVLGRAPARNDAIDIAHFLYLVPEATLVTTDRSLAQLAARLEIPCYGPDSLVAGA